MLCFSSFVEIDAALITFSQICKMQNSNKCPFSAPHTYHNYLIVNTIILASETHGQDWQPFLRSSCLKGRGNLTKVAFKHQFCDQQFEIEKGYVMWHLYFNRPLIILIFYIFGFLFFMKQLKGIWHKTFLKKTGSFLFSSGTKYCISKNGKILFKINLDFNHFNGNRKWIHSIILNLQSTNKEINI